MAFLLLWFFMIRVFLSVTFPIWFSLHIILFYHQLSEIEKRNIKEDAENPEDNGSEKGPKQSEDSHEKEDNNKEQHNNNEKSETNTP